MLLSRIYIYIYIYIYNENENDRFKLKQLSKGVMALCLQVLVPETNLLGVIDILEANEDENFGLFLFFFIKHIVFSSS